MTSQSSNENLKNCDNADIFSSNASNDTTSTEKLNDEKQGNKIEKIKLDVNNGKFISTFGMGLGLLMFFGWFIAVFLLLTGSLITRTIIIVLLIYQFCFAKRSEFYRQCLVKMKTWEYFKSYTVYWEEELKTEKSLFAFHPHGIFGFGAAMMGAKSQILYDAIVCGSRALLNLPISGIFSRWLGLEGVNNANFKDFLKKQKNIVFVPGGFEEATLTQYKKERVFIKDRKGFIKYALQYGYRVHPCYTFNENQIYRTFNHFEKLRLFVNKLKLPGVVFFSRFLFFPDYDVDLCVVIGKSIQFPQISEPTNELIDQYHNLYVEALVALYNRYKKQFNSADELEIN